MATIDSGSRRLGRRPINHDLPLVPFIDFLICLVVFLLAEVGFAQLARLPGSALVPGKISELPAALPKRLHVHLEEHRFRVTWREGATVVASSDVPRESAVDTQGVRRYPELARFLEQDFRNNGVHRDATDPVLDEAVVHVPNSAAYEDVIGLLDALRAPRRTAPWAQQTSVFAVSLAAD